MVPRPVAAGRTNGGGSVAPAAQVCRHLNDFGVLGKSDSKRTPDETPSCTCTDVPRPAAARVAPATANGGAGIREVGEALPGKRARRRPRPHVARPDVKGTDDETSGRRVYRLGLV
jgi:hypothetical protein